MSDDDDLIGMAPVDFFFSKEVDCHQLASSAQKGFTKESAQKYLLPPLGEVWGEECFAEVSMGWLFAGLFFYVQVQQPDPLIVKYPDFREGDSIELFIDTRALASAKTTHRFCHHFYFLPELFEGRSKGECTRFRTEDTHPLCSEEQLECTMKTSANGYTASIVIPNECLVGYDPQVGAKLGFTYRINRPQMPGQHFAMANDHPRIDTMPCLWAKLKLTEEKL